MRESVALIVALFFIISRGWSHHTSFLLGFSTKLNYCRTKINKENNDDPLMMTKQVKSQGNNVTQQDTLQGTPYKRG